MADSLAQGMNNMKIGGGQPEARSYIPPHMRGQAPAGGPPMNGGPPPMNGGINNSAWAAPAP